MNEKLTLACFYQCTITHLCTATSVPKSGTKLVPQDSFFYLVAFVSWCHQAGLKNHRQQHSVLLTILGELFWDTDDLYKPEVQSGQILALGIYGHHYDYHEKGFILLLSLRLL